AETPAVDLHGGETGVLDRVERWRVIGNPVAEVSVHLDAGAVPQVADAQVGDRDAGCGQRPAQTRLGPVDPAEAVGGDRDAVRDAGGQAGRRRLVPRGQA